MLRRRILRRDVARVRRPGAALAILEPAHQKLSSSMDRWGAALDLAPVIERSADTAIMAATASRRARDPAAIRHRGRVSDWLVVSPAPFQPRLRRVRSARRRAVTVSLRHRQLPKPRHRQAARHWCFCTMPHLRWSSRCNSPSSRFDNNNGAPAAPIVRALRRVCIEVTARPRSRARALVLVASNAAS
jgi:hypothetical protein